MSSIQTTTIALVSIGNTNLSVGKYDGGKVTDVSGMPADKMDELVATLDEMGADAVVLSSVNEAFAKRATEAIEKKQARRIYRAGADIEIPLHHSLSDEAIAKTGQDRLLCALGAFGALAQACVVVDAGTAVTVDFVDGEGVFHGGAIAPGASMQLRALSEGTDALPMLSPEKPVGSSIGPDTFGAMQRGVHFGIRGLVRLLTEQYATEYEGYPIVIATGGDAAMLFSNDELIDRIAPDLVLQGLARCCAEAMDEGGEGSKKLRGPSGGGPSDN